jgi:basic membrane lipoprotein Med (substrate-binding protein (PBP1-ABC) superfamily)
MSATFYFYYKKKNVPKYRESISSSMIMQKIFIILFLFLYPNGALYQFVQLEELTLFFDGYNNQRTIFFCNVSGNCSYGSDDWISFDTLQSTPTITYSLQDFTYVYNQIHKGNNNIKACILYDSDFSGLGYIYEIEKARLKIIEDFNYIVDYVSNIDFTVNLRDVVQNLSSQNYNVIIGTSVDHEDIYQFYDQFDNIKFLMISLDWLDGLLVNKTKGLINFYNIDSFWQIWYVTGAFGALYTKSNETCYIAPGFDPSQLEFINYYYLGLNEVNPNIKLYTYPIGTFSNVTLELYALEKCLEDHPNVDLIIYHTNNGIIPQIAANMGIKVIGYSTEGRILYGENIIASIQINWYNMFYDFFKKIKNNNLVNQESIYYFIKNGGYVLGDFSKLVRLEDINFVTAIEYGMAIGTYQLNCTNSIQILCERLGGCGGPCLTFSLSGWINNSNFIIYPTVVIPEKTIEYIYIDSAKTWVATLFLILDLIVISYFLIPIIYLIIAGIRDYEKMLNRNGDFLIISFFGAIILVIGSIIIFGTPLVWKCQAQLALISLGFDLFYLPFFTRILRVLIIKTFAVGREIVIKNHVLHLITGFVVIFEIGYLVIWFSISPLEITKILISNTTQAESYYLDCGYQDNNNTIGTTFLLISVFFKTFLSLACWIISDFVSSIGDKIAGWDKERKKRFKNVTNASELKITVVLTFIILNILAMCLLAIATNVITKFVAISITIYVFVISCTITIIITLFKPLVYGEKKEVQSSKKREGSSAISMTEPIITSTTASSALHGNTTISEPSPDVAEIVASPRSLAKNQIKN